MIIRVDKCHTFGMAEKETLSVQTHPELFINNEQIVAFNNEILNTWVDILTLKWTLKNIKKSYQILPTK